MGEEHYGSRSRRPEDGGATRQRDALVDNLKQLGCITEPRVEAAFRAVPRHLFLPGIELERVYTDEAIVTKRENGIAISASSQPAIMAVMLEQLDPQPGDHVLEIGAATGYNAGLIATLAGESGSVVTIDIDEDLVKAAREHLTAAGIGGAGSATVEVVCADGAFGHPEKAPYDRIILTVGAWDIAPAWLDQLKPGGRLVLPLSLRGPQRSIAFDWDGRVLRSASVKDCGFMLMRGAFGGRQGAVSIGPTPGLYVGVDDRFGVDADQVYRLLTGPSKDLPAGVRITTSEAFGGLNVWLSLREPAICRLGAEGERVPHELVPPLFGWGAQVGTIALLGGDGLAALMRPPGQPAAEPRDGDLDRWPFDLWLRAFGDGAAAERLRELVLAWDAAGRPESERLQIDAYPIGMHMPAFSGMLIERPQTTLVLAWDAAAEESASRGGDR